MIPQPLKIKTVCSFEALGVNNPAAQHINPDILNPQYQHCVNLEFHINGYSNML